MKRSIVASAAILSLGLTNITTGHTTEPISAIPDNLFQPLPVYGAQTVPETIIETLPQSTPYVKPVVPVPVSKPLIVSKTKPTPVTKVVGSWIFDSEVSWYGPGFYGKRTACGKAYTKEILGVAHKSLPCGTMVTFKYRGKDGQLRVLTVPVIDRGPYVAGRQWDLSGGLCVALHHCFTGPIYYAVGSH